ncbi:MULTISPECIES: hypothetical protein [Nocardia]|uniref:Uncharacterized protein n=1 Tax=Nocardia elegans TaxID=300029 RepID=A0ABW6TEN2_9NOCA|nr:MULTISPECIES: hypothetical protein [Nocardia]MBF6447355.1 hypothetical protein [Nocardia elegans]
MNEQRRDSFSIESARRLQRHLPAEVTPGLTDSEFDSIESRYHFRFADDHRAFLAAGLPVDEPGESGWRGWPDWRHEDPDVLGTWLAQPAEGVLFDVEHNGFWHPAWGDRPADPIRCLDIARRGLADAPQLIPVFGHRFLPGIAGQCGHPVVSIVQTDAIYAGLDLSDYLRREFLQQASDLDLAHATAPFWNYLLGDSGGPPDLRVIAPSDPYAVSPDHAVEQLRMLALERHIGRPVEPEKLVEAALVALVLDIDSESLPLLGGLARAEIDQAEELFDQVLNELDIVATIPTDECDIRHLLVRWWLRQITQGHLPPVIGAELISTEAWMQLNQPESLRPLLELTDRYGDWEANQAATPFQLATDIVTAAQGLLHRSWAS